MGVQIDLIVPPIIIGLLVVLIFRMNAFIMESSADSHLINSVQTQADVAIDIIQEELRGLSGTFTTSQDTLQFSKSFGAGATQNFLIIRDDTNRQLKIYFDDLVSGDPDSTIHGLNLSAIQFTSIPPHILRVRVESESLPEQHVRFRNDQQTVRAVSERDFILRNNIFAIQNQSQNQ